MKPLWSDWRKVGFSLMRWGINIAKPLLTNNQFWLLETVTSDTQLELARKLTITQVTANELSQLTKRQLNVEAWCWDSKYNCIKLTDFQAIIASDFTNRMKWLAETWDCDNFASLFSSLMSLIYNFNGAGIALGAVVNKQTKQIEGYHAYNCVILDTNNTKKLYLYEPQADILKPAAKETDMEWGVYRTDLVIYH